MTGAAVNTGSVAQITEQHLEDVIVLFGNREVLLSAGQANLIHLRRIDERLASHLDGLAIAGEDAWAMCERALDGPSRGTVFAAAVHAIRGSRRDRLGRLFLLGAADPEARRGLNAALGWVEAAELETLVPALLASEQSFLRFIAVAASAMHRVDPGVTLARLCDDEEPLVRARARRAAGELGRQELAPVLTRALSDEDPAAKLWAAWSAVLMGNRLRALQVLTTAASDRAWLTRALPVLMLALPLHDAHGILTRFAADPSSVRMLVRGAGLCGDPVYVPWLISHMADDRLARLAGESFSLITGLDLAWLDLERKPPQESATGPDDNPEDPDVAMSEDDGLPWPDQARIRAWWEGHGGRFAAGVRHFMGVKPDPTHCLHVLRNGYQRQRIAASYHLCLLNPGTPLFDWRAPAWRQQRLLEQTS